MESLPPTGDSDPSQEEEDAEHIHVFEVIRILLEKANADREWEGKAAT
jgi:hypothetical protein